MVKLFWLSFTDPDRPDGAQHLGCCVVEVDEDEAAAAQQDVRARFPVTAEGTEWLAAAIAKAWEMACNPGGEVAAIELDPADMPEDVPRNRLMSRAELRKRGLLA